MRQASIQDPHGLHDELTRALATTRGGNDAGKLARHLLSNDAATTLLVGITTDGNATTYTRSSWSVQLVDLPETNRLDNIEVTSIANRRTLTEFEQWLKDRDSALFAWIHPCYR